jgi:hypothetical protein
MAELPYTLVGSCVTRDAADIGRDPLPKPLRYFSRTRIQSLVSTPSPVDGDRLPLKSGFQRRVIVEDHRKDAARRLPQVDHPVLIDLIDERARLLHTGSGLVAGSSYFDRSGLADRPGTVEVDEDAALETDGPFAEAAARFAALLPPQPVVVHRAFWAVSDIDGRDLEERADAERANTWLTRAYDLLETAIGDRAQAVEPPAALRIADPAHRWGLAPFHYIPAYYDDLAAQIRAALNVRA